jgi:ubiquinone/menaquinone biosynthesis C-methylase UbiE
MSDTGKWEDAVAWLRSQPDRQEFVRACYYDLPVSSAAARYESSDEWREALKLLPATSGRALDVGAGNGIVSYALAKAGWAVTALEPDPSDFVGAGAIRELSDTGSLNIRVVQEFGEKMPFGDAEFNLVYARQVMHHAYDLEQFCKEAARVLAVGGTFIGSREHVISSSKQLPDFLDSHPLHKLYGGENAFTLQQYTEAMERAGLKVVRVLKPFDSPINYSPQTRDTIAIELQKRLKRLPLGFIPANVLKFDFIRSLSMRILSQIDRRPGRVYSFVAIKQGGSR